MLPPKKIPGLAHKDKVILFGLREGKPQAALFEDVATVQETAKSLALGIVRVKSERAMWIASQLVAGKLTGQGRVFFPFVKREVYDVLNALVIEASDKTQANADEQSDKPAFKSSPSVADSVRAALAADDTVSSDASQRASGSEGKTDDEFERQEQSDGKLDSTSDDKAETAVSDDTAKATSLADSDGTPEELLDAWYWLIRPGQIVLAAELDNNDRPIGWWEAEVIDVTDEAYMVQFPSDMRAGILPRTEQQVAVLRPKA